MQLATLGRTIVIDSASGLKAAPSRGMARCLAYSADPWSGLLVVPITIGRDGWPRSLWLGLADVLSSRGRASNDAEAAQLLGPVRGLPASKPGLADLWIGALIV